MPPDKLLKEQARLAFRRAQDERALDNSEFAQELGRLLGRIVRPNQVSMWRTGYRDLGAVELLAAAVVAGKPVSFFLRESELTRLLEDL